MGAAGAAADSPRGAKAAKRGTAFASGIFIFQPPDGRDYPLENAFLPLIDPLGCSFPQLLRCFSWLILGPRKPSQREKKKTVRKEIG